MGLYVTTRLWVYMLLQCYGFICYYTVMGLYVTTMLWVYMLLHCYGFICYYNVMGLYVATLLWVYMFHNVMKQTIHGALKCNELNSVLSLLWTVSFELCIVI